MNLEALHAAARNPVVRHILERKLQNATGKAPDTRRRLGILAEGGAMRSVISGGHFIGLDFLGLRQTFDRVYGSSAGAINAAYFMSGQIAHGVAVYYQLINNSKFVNLWKALSLRPGTKIVDMDFLFDTIITDARALDAEALRGSRTELLFTATDIEDGSRRLFSSREESLDLAMALKAGASIPVAYNHPVTVGDRLYLDGSVADALPVHQALDDGITDLLVLLTEPRGHRKTPSKGMTRLYERVRLRRFPAAFREAYFHQAEHYNNSLDLLESLATSESEMNVTILAPRGPLSKIETNGVKLRCATAAAVEDLLQTFGCDDVAIGEVLRPVRRTRYQALPNSGGM